MIESNIVTTFHCETDPDFRFCVTSFEDINGDLSIHDQDLGCVIHLTWEQAEALVADLNDAIDRLIWRKNATSKTGV